MAVDAQLRALEGRIVRAAELTPGDGKLTLRFEDGSHLSVQVAPPLNGVTDVHHLRITHQQVYTH